MDNAGSHTEHLLQSHVRNSSHSFSFPVVGARQNGSNAPLNESAPHRLQQSNLPKAASPHADGIGGPSSAPQSVRAESTISQLSVGDGTSRSVRKSSAPFASSTPASFRNYVWPFCHHPVFLGVIRKP